MCHHFSIFCRSQASAAQPYTRQVWIGTAEDTSARVSFTGGGSLALFAHMSSHDPFIGATDWPQAANCVHRSLAVEWQIEGSLKRSTQVSAPIGTTDSILCIWPYFWIRDRSRKVSINSLTASGRNRTKCDFSSGGHLSNHRKHFSDSVASDLTKANQPKFQVTNSTGSNSARCNFDTIESKSTDVFPKILRNSEYNNSHLEK